MPSSGLSDPMSPAPPIVCARAPRAHPDVGRLHHVDVGARGAGGHCRPARNWSTSSSHMPGASAIGASRRGRGEPGREEDHRQRRRDGRPGPGETRRAIRGTGACGRPGPIRSRCETPGPSRGPHRQPDARRVGGEGHHHAAERQRGDHRPIGRRELREQPLDRASEELLASGDEGLLVDDEHEAAAGGHAVVGAVGRRQARGRASGAIGAGAAATRRSDRTVRTRSSIRISTSDG